MEGEIIFNIDVMLAKRKMSVTELSERVGITLTNMSILKTGKAKAIRVSTLRKLCEVLDCQPGDLLEYRPGAGGLEAADGKIYGAFFLLSVFGIISAALLPLSVGMLCKSGGRRAVKRLSVAAAAADNVIYLVFFCLLILVDRDWVGWIIPVWIIDLLLCIVLLACSEVREK